MRLLLILAMFFVTPLYASDVAVARWENGDYIRLFMETCPVTSGWLKLYKAEWFYKGKMYQACWTVHDKFVVVHDEQGATSPLPINKFSKEVRT